MRGFLNKRSHMQKVAHKNNLEGNQHSLVGAWLTDFNFRPLTSYYIVFDFLTAVFLL